MLYRKMIMKRVAAIVVTLFFYTASVQAQEAASATMVTAAKADITNGYKLGANDNVRMTIFGEDDLTGEYEVDGTGSLSLPLVGEVPVLGKTIREVEILIADKYKEGFLVNPRVSLEITDFRPFFILGEVNNPGGYPYVNGMIVLNAVALAGGYTYRAKTEEILLKRTVNGKIQETEVSEETPVMPGDVLRVQERFF